MLPMTDDPRVRVHMLYDGGDYALDGEDDEWRRIADRYEAAAAEGGGWVDAPTSKGVLTVWASAGVPVAFRQTRQRSAYGAVLT